MIYRHVFYHSVKRQKGKLNFLSPCFLLLGKKKEKSNDLSPYFLSLGKKTKRFIVTVKVFFQKVFIKKIKRRWEIKKEKVKQFITKFYNRKR